MKIEKKIYGNLNNREIHSYRLINDNNMEATFLNLGGTNISLVVPDKNGNKRDIVMSYVDLKHLEEDPCFFGAIIARNGNRIANAKANISGVEYNLDNNDNGNNLHSGLDFFHKKILDARTNESNNEVYVEFAYRFKDMEQNYPGNMDLKIRYTLTNENELKIRYEATTDKDTIFNTTWHSYFNFIGHNANDISTHKIKIFADKFTYINDILIPTELKDTRGTKLDFVSDYRYMNDGIDDSYEQIVKAKGFDHNYAINGYNGELQEAALVIEENVCIRMDVLTDLPGIQFYSGNFIDTPYPGKENAKYVKRGAFCLETQYFPNAINDSRFVSPLLKANETKVTNTIYKFSTI